MDLQLQIRLLRVLQEGTLVRVGSNKEIKLDVRVVAATNRDLAQMVKEGKFREDLFYRLQGFLIHMPPLRDRGSDIILLANFFLNDFSQINKLGKKSFSPQAEKAMLAYHWPGNVRELKSMVQRAAVMADGDTIHQEDLIFATPFKN
jgi:DNA-binding NtrC family response regulator